MSLWTGDFGDAYTKRNLDADTDHRATVLRGILPRHIDSILEVGANIGANLNAIATFRNIEMFACEPNDLARKHIKIEADHVTADFASKLSFPDGVADLVMTIGVLIHVGADALLPSMREIYRCSRRFILVGEYFAPDERAMPYRGQDEALWLRDYGGLFIDSFPDLRCLSCTFAWKRMTGLDNITFWLLEKTDGH